MLKANEFSAATKGKGYSLEQVTDTPKSLGQKAGNEILWEIKALKSSHISLGI